MERSGVVRRVVAALAVLAALTAATACSGSSDDDGADEAPAGGDGAGDGDAAGSGGDDVEAPEPEVFTGTVEDFYTVPDPLPSGEPGQLIRVQEVESTPETTTVRVMYHSLDAQRKDRAVTGIVVYPTDPGGAPEEGWPVLSWSHGTTGIAPKCAPSRGPLPVPTFGVRGVIVATDYVGLGPEGEIHPYLSKYGEGYAAIDAVRAAIDLPEAHAGTRWLSAGHSQGGHGALSAAELSADHAPELELLGTLAYAPGAELTKSYGDADAVVTQVVGAMMLYGAVGEHPELVPEDYAGPELEAVADVIRNECLDAVGIAVAPIPADAVFKRDPRTEELTRSILEANEVGTVRVDAPLLLISGTADTTVVIDRVRDLYARLCEIGQVTELVEVEGADHGDVIPRTSDTATTWLAERLAGEPPTDTCATAPPE
ncbi:MAG TPA: lipase family protein [Acidimicrobiales bacterium]